MPSEGPPPPKKQKKKPGKPTERSQRWKEGELFNLEKGGFNWSRLAPPKGYEAELAINQFKMSNRMPYAVGTPGPCLQATHRVPSKKLEEEAALQMALRARALNAHWDLD